MNYLDKKIAVSPTSSKTLREIVGDSGLWMVWKLPILSYNSIKKLAKEANLQPCCEPKLVCTPTDDNKMQHIWIIWLQDASGNKLYSEWEASKYNTGKWVGNPAKYVELTQIDAQYRSRMAYKRAYCRCVLDILWLDEFYSDSDASAFQKSNSQQEDNTINITDL